MTAAVSDQKICFVTDVEGNLEYFQRIVANSELIYYDKEGALALKPNVIFVFGGMLKYVHQAQWDHLRLTHALGDISDKGTGSIRFASQLLALKKRYFSLVRFALLNTNAGTVIEYASSLEIGTSTR